MSNFDDVKIFMKTYGQEIKHKSGFPEDKVVKLRVDLIKVQLSNMSKLGEDGKPIYNDNGKVMKGPNYFQPDLKKYLLK